jgi:glutaredoxin 3
MTRIIVYTTPYWGYCRAATRLLNKKEIDVSEDMEPRQDMISRAFGRRQLPQIFVNVTYVCRYDELAELECGGKLDMLLAEAYALVPAPGE